MNFRALSRSLVQRVAHPGPFELTEALFLRLLGLVYLIAFGSLWPQILGLIGSAGIVPASQYLSSVHVQLGMDAIRYVPTIFLAGVSDGALVGACVAGCIASLGLLIGVWPRVSAGLCFVLYLSITTVGEPFTSFQWDALLLESGFLALFAGAPWILWAYRFLLFRLMLESGAVKLLSHDANWRNFHALRFHFVTQPIPNPIAYYVYRSPTWLLDFMTGATLGIELIAPFLLWGPKPLRYTGAGLLILLQVVIALTGNYAFFNLLSLALCLWAFDDSTFTPLARWLRRRAPRTALPMLRRAANAVLAAVILLGAVQLVGMFAERTTSVFSPVLNAIAPFEIVNSYGLFAVMTTTRPEIVIEGSDDAINWKQYSFRYKPGELHRDLPFVAPYQPRLDWQMWFAALSDYQENRWVGALIYRLLTGDATVLHLMDAPPFQKPPKYMRALLYDYQFTTPAERARSGAVWQRRLLGRWLNPVSLGSQ